MGHAFTATGDAPMITLIDSGSAYGGYNTLWIKQGDRDPNNTLATNWLGGHLELGNLTAHGIVTATGYTNSSFTHSGDIKSSRGFNTNYTNSTGKTIVVYIAVKFNGHPTSAVYYVEGYINNTPTTGVISNNYNQLYQNIVLVVPHGATYKCACSDTSNTTFDRWVETSL
ncbi:MAG: hypothetical protein M1540_02435 [Candidatus Bathyarchaeota archaeon]|nr:hypothetical protein [Candidatus Bathyarchaeota archaeon]